MIIARGGVGIPELITICSVMWLAVTIELDYPASPCAKIEYHHVLVAYRAVCPCIESTMALPCPCLAYFVLLATPGIWIILGIQQ